MKIVIDIGHPAHVFLFSNIAKQLISDGNDVFFTVREKSNNKYLLEFFQFDFDKYSKVKKSILGKIIGIIHHDISLYFLIKKIKPDLTISHGSFYLSHVSKLLKIPNLTLEDTGNFEQVSLYYPFTNWIITSESFHKDYKSKQIRYNSFHELAYLHPKYFNPNYLIIEKFKKNPNRKTVLFRFISWDASHDIGKKKMRLSQKMNLVEELSKRYNILISCEKDVPLAFEQYVLRSEHHQIHHIIAGADLYVGEGATMASESAILGIPAIYINTTEAGTINEQEKFGLLFHFKSSEGVLEKAIKILEMPDSKCFFQDRCRKMLSKKIDLTSFIVWLIENYPLSAKIIHENPDYQYNFNY